MFDFLKGKNLWWVLFISIVMAILQNHFFFGNKISNKQLILIIPLFLVCLFFLNRLKPFNMFLNELFRGKDVEEKWEMGEKKGLKQKIKNIIFGKKE
tara:strand:- start:221 stop:511 length:291 start_codon:yes stop_codon:yes gene_type:complete